MRSLAAALVAASLFSACSAIYLPGAKLRQFKDGERVRPTLPFRGGPVTWHGVCPSVSSQVELKTNKMTSTRTHLGYSFYDLPHCVVRDRPAAALHSLGRHGPISAQLPRFPSPYSQLRARPISPSPWGSTWRGTPSRALHTSCT